MIHTFPYQPEACPGRAHTSPVNRMVGCSLCGSALTFEQVEEINRAIAEEKPWIVLCRGLRNLFIEDDRYKQVTREELPDGNQTEG